jgi:hypothetical protein
MFHKTRITVFSFFGLCLAGWIANYALMKKGDSDRFRTIIEQKLNPQAQAFSSAYQTRKGVTKDLWYTQEDSLRIHHRISSQSSILTLIAKKNRIDIVELLENLNCTMQDKLYYTSSHDPMQQMRFFSAAEGTYRYTTQQFVAQAVELSLYRLPSHRLPDRVDPKDSYLQGIAEDVSFFISDKIPQFHAEHFKANLKQSPQLPKNALKK